MTRLRLERLCKRYGPVVAVHDLSLALEPGEFLALLGPSGCGKSSTLKMIAGVEAPSAGEIFFDDRAVSSLPPARRNIAMVFEDYALYPRLTAAENIAFPLRIRRVARADVARQVERVAAMLRIDGLLDQPVQALSGGQQQRVGIGRALVRDPDLLLLDEPLSHLDAELKAELRAELKRLQRETGVTTIMVTHDQVEAMAMADRIAVMDAGRLHQAAGPEEIYRCPATAFVAGFIGEPPMNLWPAAIEEDGGALRLATGHRVPLPVPVRERLKTGPGAAVSFGLRPEAVVPSREPSRDSLPCAVVVRELRGDEETIHLRAGDLCITAETSASFGARAGEIVHCRVDPEAGHFFDRVSGENLLRP
jgi:ABC-type sugar transport system ATPase subunit